MDDLKISTVIVMWILILLGFYSGCEECTPGEEKCSSEYYHMKCVETEFGTGNWTIEENCFDT